MVENTSLGQPEHDPIAWAVDSRKEIHTKYGGVLKVYSADAATKHGYSFSAIIIDELHAQLVGHGHGGKVAFVHIGLMQGEGDLQTLQQARGIGLGYFFAAHSACDKLVIETGDGVIWPASRP